MTQPFTSPPPSWLSRVARFSLILLIIGLGVGVSKYWLANKPKAQRRKPPVRAALVDAVEVQPENHRVIISAMGTVTPARTIQLTSRVSGEVAKLSPAFAPGGKFSAGEVAVVLDRADLEIALQQQKSEIARREAELAQRRGEVEKRAKDLELADIQIDRSKKEITRRESEIVEAESVIALEMGQQSVARREYELLGEEISEDDKALVLRQPQLNSAKAAHRTTLAAKELAESDVASAEAQKLSALVQKQTAEAAVEAAEASLESAKIALKKMKLDLERTEVRVPINSAVSERKVDLGAQASPGATLATLIGTDEFWVEISVPADELKWLLIPGSNSTEGSPVRVYYEAGWGREADGSQVFRKGRIVKLLPGVEAESRMARLLVSVEDPLDLKKPEDQRRALMLGSFVNIEAEGRELEDVVKVQRTALRDGSKVWLLTDEDMLGIEEVEIAWKDKDFAYIRNGIKTGDFLITSDLGAPVPGMSLRIKDTPSGPAREGMRSAKASPGFSVGEDDKSSGN